MAEGARQTESDSDREKTSDEDGTGKKEGGKAERRKGDTVHSPHPLVQLLRGQVLLAHKQVDEPGPLLVAGLLEPARQTRSVAEPPRSRRDRERRDVPVPGEVVRVRIRVWGVGRDGRGEGRGLELTKDWMRDGFR